MNRRIILFRFRRVPIDPRPDEVLRIRRDVYKTNTQQVVRVLPCNLTLDLDFALARQGQDKIEAAAFTQLVLELDSHAVFAEIKCHRMLSGLDESSSN